MGLRELRQTKGLTLKGLAALSGVNYMKIHQIETGKIHPENIALKTAVKLVVTGASAAAIEAVKAAGGSLTVAAASAE